MIQIHYITIEQAIDTHIKTIHASDGGDIGLLNKGQLDSILAHIQNDCYYPSFTDKLTHLFWGICKFHCFVDGNKRTAISLGTLFLLINGYQDLAESFIRFMENISFYVAAGKIDKDLLQRIIYAFMNGLEEDETLKLEIYNAIKDDLDE